MENQSISETGKRGIFVWREKHEMFLLQEAIIHDSCKNKQNQSQTEEGETAEEIRKRAVEKLGETRKRMISNDEDGGGGRAPEGKQKKSGEQVEILKESIKVNKFMEDADREFKGREMRLKEQKINMQQQFQLSLLEQQQQFQVQQDSMTSVNSSVASPTY